MEKEEQEMIIRQKLMNDDEILNIINKWWDRDRDLSLKNLVRETIYQLEKKYADRLRNI